MTDLSQTLYVAQIINNKGSIYGEASKTPSPHSFQQFTRSGEFVCAYRTKVLPNEATLYSTWHLKELLEIN